MNPESGVYGAGFRVRADASLGMTAKSRNFDTVKISLDASSFRP
jgi:hypothetical protein